MEMSRQRSCRDVLLIRLVKVQERVKRVDTFVRDIMQPDEAGPFDELLPWANMSTNLAGDYQVPNLQQ